MGRGRFAASNGGQMSLFYVPSGDPNSWTAVLASPETQFVHGDSARTLAYCWEASRGFPPEVRAALDTCDDLRGIETILGIREPKVDLYNAKRPSQNDLFVLARTARGLASIVFEGKAKEPFGNLVSDWTFDANPNNVKRVAHPCNWLAIDAIAVFGAHYQPLHRTESAPGDAARFSAGDAVMLVHSNLEQILWHDANERFAKVMRAVNAPKKAVFTGGVRLHVGWVSGDRAFRQVYSLARSS